MIIFFLSCLCGSEQQFKAQKATSRKPIKYSSLEEGVIISEFRKNLMLNYQSEQKVLDRADNSYADYKKTAKSISLEQLMKNHDLGRKTSHKLGRPMKQCMTVF